MGESQLSGHFKFLGREPGTARERVSFGLRPNHLLPLGKIHPVFTVLDAYAEGAAVLLLCQNTGRKENTDKASQALKLCTSIR